MSSIIRVKLAEPLVDLSQFSYSDFLDIFGDFLVRYPSFQTSLSSICSDFSSEGFLFAISKSFNSRFSKGSVDYFRQYYLFTYKDRVRFLSNLKNKYQYA